MTYTIKDTQVPRKLKAPGYVRRVAWDDKDFKELHTKFASKTHGCLYRNNLAWEEYFRWVRMIPSLRSTIPLMMCRTATWSI